MYLTVGASCTASFEYCYAYHCCSHKCDSSKRKCEVDRSTFPVIHLPSHRVTLYNKIEICSYYDISWILLFRQFNDYIYRFRVGNIMCHAVSCPYKSFTVHSRHCRRLLWWLLNILVVIYRVIFFLLRLFRT